MKNIKWSLFAVISMSSMVLAGGEIDAPTIIETEVITPTVVSEHTGFYAGLALSAVSTRESGASLSFTSENAGQDRLGNVTLLAGYTFHENVAVEGRYTTTISSEDTAEMSGFSIFVKPQYNVSEEFTVYGLVGYGAVTIDNATAASNVDIDDSGFQWGLGASYDVSNDVSVFVDYTSLANDMDGRYINANSADVDAVTVGITYKF